eukprot:1157016-Pelagomonas_calceolata.AAC.3
MPQKHLCIRFLAALIKIAQQTLRSVVLLCNASLLCNAHGQLQCAAALEKAEIQALSSFGFQYLTEEYLPRKLAAGDWC